VSGDGPDGEIGARVDGRHGNAFHEMAEQFIRQLSGRFLEVLRSQLRL
jgi:hypothetical protein